MKAREFLLRTSNRCSEAAPRTSDRRETGSHEQLESWHQLVVIRCSVVVVVEVTVAAAATPVVAMDD